MKKVGRFFLDIAKGIGMGVSAIIPGVSGGTFAVALNCYDEVIIAIANIFKQFGKSFLILLPYAIGVVIGGALGFFGVSQALAYIMFSIIALFAGLILGSIPNLVNEVRKEKIKNEYILGFNLSFIFVVAIALIAFVISIEHPHLAVEQLFIEPKWYLYLIMIPVGFIGAFALVAPGISGSMILLVIGFYEPILDMIKNVITQTNLWQNVGLLACFALGVVVGFFIMSKIMKKLLEHHKALTYSIIIGFVLGSLIAIFFNKSIYVGNDTYIGIINNPKELFLGIPLFILGTLGSYFTIRLSHKKGAKTQ